MEKPRPNIVPKSKMEFGQYIPYTTRKKIFTASRVLPALLASLKRVATTSLFTRITNGKSYIPPLLSMILLLNMILETGFIIELSNNKNIQFLTIGV